MQNYSSSTAPVAERSHQLVMCAFLRMEEGKGTTMSLFVPVERKIIRRGSTLRVASMKDKCQ